MLKKVIIATISILIVGNVTNANALSPNPKYQECDPETKDYIQGLARDGNTSVLIAEILVDKCDYNGECLTACYVPINGRNVTVMSNANDKSVWARYNGVFAKHTVK